jgi:hypothetical protein
MRVKTKKAGKQKRRRGIFLRQAMKIRIVNSPKMTLIQRLMKNQLLWKIQEDTGRPIAARPRKQRKIKEGIKVHF